MIKLEKFLHKQKEWSSKVFGPGRRTLGIIKHIKAELEELERDPSLSEWVDVVLLALDGAWRSANYDPDSVVEMLVLKQRMNMGRKWNRVSEDEPLSEDEPSFHIR